MKLTLLQENLSSSLLKISKFIDSKVQLPILANILFVAEKNKLEISATNLETGINLGLPAKVEKEGKITIPAKGIVEFISSLPADQLSFELNKEKIKIKCRNYSAVFNGVSAAEFPAIPSSKKIKKDIKKVKISLSLVDFIEAINNVAYTAAIDETRPVLTGVKFSFNKDELSMASTDGYRLSRKIIKQKRAASLKGLIIPARTLVELAKICEQLGVEEDSKVDIIVIEKENQLIFNYKEVEIVSRLIEGEFPDFEKIIPTEKITSLVIDREDLQGAVKTASIFAKDSANIVRFKIEKNNLEISANAPEVGENKIDLKIKTEGENNTIAFNFRFLQDFLNSINSKEVILDIVGPLKPGVFRLVNDKSLIHIIMPVRVQE